MAPKASFLLAFGILVSLLAACTPKATVIPTADQNIISTAVAATLDAAATASHAAIPTIQPALTTIPTSKPTVILPTSTPAALPSPTVAIPTGSPQRITYTKNSDVYLWIDGNDPVRLTDMHDVVSLRLSDDGQLIAFKRQNPDDVTLQELWVVNTQGIPEPRVLISAADLAKLLPPNPDQYILGAGILDYTWRPSTHIVAYNTLILHEGPGLGPNHDVRLVNADTLEKTTLFETGEGGFFYFSPDGNQIALSNPDSISLVNADGTNMQKDVLTFPNVITYSEYQYHPHPVWGDDSRALGVAIPPHDPMADPLPDTTLWSIPADGSAPSLLSQVPAMPFAWPNQTFAPSLEDVIYVAQVEGSTDNQNELHLAQPDGSNDIIYDQDRSLIFLSWSPNSQHFIYEINEGANKGVYLGGLVSQSKLVISDPGMVLEIKWLGSNQLVFPFRDGNEWMLFVQDPTSGMLERIDIIPDSSLDFDVLP
jgi:hypothetical protein